ncbi:MAG: glycosyl hydrolase [Planctomycetota bacterium]
MFRDSELSRCRTALLTLAVMLLPTAVEAQTRKAGWAGGGGESFFAPLNTDWWYNWGLNEGGNSSGDADFYPMFWGGVNQNGINSVLSRPEPVEYVLGFNEPERSDQANLSVSTALSEWRELVDGLDGSGIKLVSPAPSDTGDGRAWLVDFMNGVNADPNLHVDAVAFHWYGANSPDNVAGAANNFLNSVSWYRNQFSLPVMITEFGIHDWGGNYSDAAIQEANRQFLDIVVPELERRSYVEAYSPFPWFPDLRLVTSSPDGRIATDAGEVYAGLYTDGEVFDMAGQDQGSDIIYLRGGTLTSTSRGEPTVGSVYALSGDSQIDGSQWTVTQQVQVAPGATLRKTGTGTVTVAGADLQLDGLLRVEEGMLILNDTGITERPGRVHIASSGTLRFVGPGRGASFTPDITLAGGSLEVEGSATLRGDLIVEADSEIDVEDVANAQLGLRAAVNTTEFRKLGAGVFNVGSSPSFLGVLAINEGTTSFNDGEFTIAASAVDVAAGATLDAAGSNATIDGDLTLAAGSTLAVGLDGSTLSVLGTAELNDATLAVSSPSPVAAGMTFDLFDWTNSSGDFGDLQLPALEGGAAWFVANLTTTGELASVIAGDFNGDGAVDATDYTVWRDNQAASVNPWSPGDANGDGAINAADHAIWVTNFGAVPALSTAVPEPAGLLVALLGMAAAARWRTDHW